MKSYGERFESHSWIHFSENLLIFLVSYIHCLNLSLFFFFFLFYMFESCKILCLNLAMHSRSTHVLLIELKKKKFLCRSTHNWVVTKEADKNGGKKKKNNAMLEPDNYIIWHPLKLKHACQLCPVCQILQLFNCIARLF